MRQISRDDLRALLASGGVTLVEALPDPHDAAEHLSAVLTAWLAARLVPGTGLPFGGCRAISGAAR